MKKQIEIKLTEEKTNFLLVKIWTGDEWYSECNWAIVKLDEKLIKSILLAESIIPEVKLKLKDFYKMSLWTNEIYYLNDDLIANLEDENEEFDSLEDVEEYSFINLIDENILSEVETIRTEAEQLEISEYGFRYICYVKNTDIELYCSTMGTDILRGEVLA